MQATLSEVKFKNSVCVYTSYQLHAFLTVSEYHWAYKDENVESEIKGVSDILKDLNKDYSSGSGVVSVAPVRQPLVMEARACARHGVAWKISCLQ